MGLTAWAPSQHRWSSLSSTNLSASEWNHVLSRELFWVETTSFLVASQSHWMVPILEELIPTPDKGLSSLSAVPLPALLSGGLHKTWFTVMGSHISLPWSKRPVEKCVHDSSIAGSTVCYPFPGSNPSETVRCRIASTVNSYVEVLTHSTSKYDLDGKQDHFRCN